MKNLMIPFMLLFSLSVFAQKSYISVGPRVGVNFANTVGDGIETDGATGLVAGITSTISIREKTGLTIEALYSQEGSEGLLDTDNSLDYLRVPLFFNYFFRDLGETFRPKVYLGVAPGILLEADGNKDAYNTFDLGIGGGIGFNYQIAERTWINTDVRYLRGLTGIIDDDSLIGGQDIYNQNIQLSLGVAWGI
jgi:hypothetical protein